MKALNQTINGGFLLATCLLGCGSQGPNDSPLGTGGATNGATGGNSGAGTGGESTSSSGGTSGSGGQTGPSSGGGSADGTGGVTSGAGGSNTGGTTGSGIIVPVGATPDERHFLVRDEGHSKVHYIDLGDATKNWHVDVPVGRELQLIGDNLFLIGTENGYEERSVIDGSVVDSVTTFAGTAAARRLRSGNTLLAGAVWQGEPGIALLEVDQNGAEQERITFPQFDYVRLVRPTPTGTYLLTSDTTIFEGDASGEVLWQVTVQDSAEPHAWKALRLPSGETVVATGYEASLQFFSATEQFLRRVKAPASVTPSFFCDFQILSNGNYLVTNWQGHGTENGALGHQIVELDAQSNLVWSWKQDASYISSIQATILLDGLDLGKLHVEDTTGVLLPVE